MYQRYTGNLMEQKDLQFKRSMGTDIPVSPIDGILLPWYEKLMGKPMHFWRDVEYHRIEICWKKSSLTKVWVSRIQVSHTGCVLLHFPMRDEVQHRMEIWWKKITYIFGKVWVPISQALSIRWVSLHFPMLWETDGKNYAFPIWSDSLTQSRCNRGCLISSNVFRR